MGDIKIYLCTDHQYHRDIYYNIIGLRIMLDCYRFFKLFPIYMRFLWKCWPFF